MFGYGPCHIVVDDVSTSDVMHVHMCLTDEIRGVRVLPQIYKYDFLRSFQKLHE